MIKMRVWNGVNLLIMLVLLALHAGCSEGGTEQEQSEVETATPPPFEAPNASIPGFPGGGGGEASVTADVYESIEDTEQLAVSDGEIDQSSDGDQVEEDGEEGGGENPEEGGENPEEGGENPEEGGENPEEGGENPAEGGENPAEGGENPEEGGENPEEGGENPEEGGESPEEGGENPEEGGESPEEGGENQAEGGENPEEGGENQEEGGENQAEGGENPAEGGENPEEGGENPAEGGENPEEGGENPAEGGENPEEGGENSEEGGENPAEGGENPEEGGENPEEGGENPEEGGGSEQNELNWEEVAGRTWINLSDAPSDHVLGLINTAVIGLGFPFGDVKGPRSEDVFLVNQHLLLWIDQTGFVGKMNGLWRLNGESGAALDFVVFEGDRPVNFLVVGEHGDGAFPSSYPGSEHIEFPNTTPENNDDPSCAEGDWCNQYAHHEASSIDNDAIPWWEACNGGSVGWDTLFEPIEEKNIGGGVRLIWEAPLVKEADGDGNWDGDSCHEQWLFADGVRRTVYLQVGYELQPDTRYLDRIVRFRNPAGNPSFTGPMSVIGGFVVSAWPNPHPSKEIHRWMFPSNQGFFEPLSGMEFVAGIWNLFIPPVLSGDWVIAWLNQAFSLSAFPTEVAGRTATLSHVGQSDNGDVGICLCQIHGGLEMGGGLLHGGISLPIAGGTVSVEARRRLELPGEETYPKTINYDAVTDFLHATGEETSGGWTAVTEVHEVGHMLYGPYTTDWSGFKGTASFSILVDNNSADDLAVVTLDVFDATAGISLGTRVVTRMEFQETFVPQSFTLAFDGKEVPADHVLEARVFWHGVSFVTVDSAAITLSGQ